MQLNMKIRNWFVDNEPGKDMLYREIWWKNNMFIRDRLLSLFDSEEAEIIGTHRSKSIVCPVIKAVYKGVEIVFQYNFYVWQIMIKSPTELKLLNLDLYKADRDYFYYQGIPEEYRFEKYSKENSKEFTISIYGDRLDVWAFAISLKLAIDSAK